MGEFVLEWLEAGVGEGFTQRVRPGDRLHFGRGGDTDTPVQLVVSNDPRVSRIAGRIAVGDEHWVVTNLSTFLALQVVDEGGAGLIRLEPTSAERDDRSPGNSATLAWESARLELVLGATDRLTIRVRARMATDRRVEPVRNGSTIPAAAMKKDKLYFRTLLVLCEQRLVDASAVVVPSDQQVSERLRTSGLDPAATPRMVERRLVDARDHLGLSTENLAAIGVPGSSIRTLIVDTAIATGAVTRADLADFGLLD